MEVKKEENEHRAEIISFLNGSSTGGTNWTLQQSTVSRIDYKERMWLKDEFVFVH